VRQDGEKETTEPLVELDEEITDDGEMG